jgi:hypothetical protein
MKCAATKISVPMAKRCGVATSISPSILFSAGAVITLFSVVMILSVHSDPCESKKSQMPLIKIKIT